jgi:NADH-quinone oxidoreductase subunit J
MTIAFYTAAAVALIATLFVIFGRNPVHALLYLVVSFLAVAVVFFVLGAPFAAALEVIIYAGAIMVLFLFVVMMLNLDADGARGSVWRQPSTWIGPALLAAVLLVQLVYLFTLGLPAEAGAQAVSPKAVGIHLMGPYLLAVELASMLLLAGLVGAWHLGRPDETRGGRGS